MLNISKMLDGSSRRCSHVYRYSSLPTIRRESVAEHMHTVAFFSFLIAKDIDAHTERDIDYGKLLSCAILHDVDENFTGDFLRIVKYSSTELKSALDTVASAGVTKICDELGVDFKSYWLRAKSSDIEGRIVELADLAGVVTYVCEELKSGNQHLINILYEVTEYFLHFERENEVCFPEVCKYSEMIRKFLIEKKTEFPR